MAYIDTLDLVLTATIGIVGATISFLLYLHNRQQRRDSWLRDFRALHKEFWEDKTFAEVRSWIANEQAYRAIVPVLIARQQVRQGKRGPGAISPDDYVVLDKLDKFCNIMTSVMVLDPSFAYHRRIWQRLFVDYWIENIFSTGREELAWYVREFYRELAEDWRTPTPAQRFLSKVRRSGGSAQDHVREQKNE